MVRIGFAMLVVAAAFGAGAGVAHAKDGADLGPVVGPIDDIVVPSPCPGPTCSPPADFEPAPHALGLRRVYVNFDAVTITRDTTWEDARDNTSLILTTASRTLPGLRLSDISDAGGYTLAQLEGFIIEDMYALFAPYEVELVTTRPSSGTYHMIVFGSTCSAVAGHSCVGISLGDCDDYMPANVSFVFPTGQEQRDIATTAAHEVAHAFGLGHTEDTDDVMYPSILFSPPDSFGAGPVPDDSGCGASYQNSHQLLLDTIGERGADFTKPTVSITSPTSGATILPGSTIRVTATDNVVVDRVQLLLNGSTVSTKTEGPYDFGVPPSTPNGALDITVYAFDLSGNLGSATVNVTVDNGAPECISNSDCAVEDHCQDGACVPDEDTGPVPGELGAECNSNAECLSGVCATARGENRCSQRCEDAGGCPDGFECLGETACWPAEESDEEPAKSIFNCSVGGERASPTLLLLALAVFAAGRRRRR